MSAYGVMGEWLAQSVNQCTCYGGDAHHGHEPGCGYEPVVKVEELKAALEAAGYAVVQLPKRVLIPTGWGADCMGAWPVDPSEDPVSAFPGQVFDPAGNYMSADRARALGVALLAAAKAVDA